MQSTVVNNASMKTCPLLHFTTEKVAFGLPLGRQAGAGEMPYSHTTRQIPENAYLSAFISPSPSSTSV